MRDGDDRNKRQRRLTAEEQAARDFLADIARDENFAEFFCQMETGVYMCAASDATYLDMVINNKQGWVIEAGKKPDATRALPPASDKRFKKRRNQG
ncbi:MAG: hypothetical protein WC889_12855 [Myxococcota bacterium]|jgi:hypothetical protein